ncbi:hypothetical protein [Microbacterium sp. ZW T5_56]|uniref:hypothetical protein n=1 Tax=Microbacterium sp. ZW T5_56 TaxID=3378081 RepID=UPI0038522338
MTTLRVGDSVRIMLLCHGARPGSPGRIASCASTPCCAETPLLEAYDAAVICEEDDDGLWHRTAGDVHEYVAVRGAVLIRVSGRGAPAGDLRAAAQAVHVPSVAELELLFSDAPQLPSGSPVERGDLPEHGDGAPIDPSGPGG